MHFTFIITCDVNPNLGPKDYNKYNECCTYIGGVDSYTIKDVVTTHEKESKE